MEYEMLTFFIRTEGPKGPRGGRGQLQAFVVVAASRDAAIDRVLSECGEDGTRVTEVRTVSDLVRVQAC